MENILETAAQQRLEVTETSKVYLLSIARWTKFLCIISLLGNFFMLLLGIGQLLIGFNSVDSPEFLGFRHFMWSLGLVCIVVGLLMTCPCIRGLKAVHTIKLAVKSDDALAFEKGLKDWDDLIKDGVEIINPDPKSSGGACWNFLAAWHFADKKFGGDETQIKDFLKALYGNVTVMDSGARGATTTFVENGQGDVLIACENEAIATVKEYPDDYEIVTPSVSILAQPSVAIVDENANKNGTQEIAKAYLEYLYSDEAQEIIAKNGYRPSNQEILNKYGDKFVLDIELCNINDFGGWNQAYEDYFKDGAIFDEIYER